MTPNHPDDAESPLIELPLKVDRSRTWLGAFHFPAVRRSWTRLLLACTVGGATIGAWLSNGRPRAVLTGAAIALGALLVWALLAFALVGAWYSTRRKATATGLEGRWGITPQGVTVVGEGVEVVTPWGLVSDFRATDRSTSFVTAFPFQFHRTEVALPPTERTLVGEWWQSSRAARTEPAPPPPPTRLSAPPQPQLPVAQPSFLPPPPAHPDGLSLVPIVSPTTVPPNTPPPSSVRISGLVTASDWGRQVGRWKWLRPIFFVVISSGLVVVPIVSGSTDPIAVALYSAVVVPTMSGAVFMTGRSFDKGIRRQMVKVWGSGPMTWTIDTMGVNQLGSSGYRIDLPWSTLTHVQVDDVVLLAKFHGLLTIVIPLRVFPEGHLAYTLAMADAGRASQSPDGPPGT